MQSHLPHANPSRIYRIAYDEALNPSQLEAVKCTQGPLLVIAGAGSGKTRTLTYRVARLVEEGIAPGSILLLSFTRKASQEMLKRASQLHRLRERRRRHIPLICPSGAEKICTEARI